MKTLISLLPALALVISASAFAETRYSCKCANGPSVAFHDYSGDYQASFEVVVPDNFQASYVTPCTEQNIKTVLTFSGENVRLTVYNSAQAEIGHEEGLWLHSDGPRDRFDLKYDEGLRHDETWDTIRTDLIPNQDVEGVVFCMER
jgi:hypothetical protein